MIIIENLDTKGIILPEYVYIIKMEDLYNAFSKYYKYYNKIFIDINKYEKTIELLDDTIKKRISIDENKITELLIEYITNT